jgi:four helix bundle protein
VRLYRVCCTKVQLSERASNETLCVIFIPMSQSIIKKKSFDFAVRVTNLCRIVRTNDKEYVITSQLLRSGTSIGANVREALNGQSKRDFVFKLSIAQKECDETRYWLELMKASDYISPPEYEELHDEATELLRIIRSIILTVKGQERQAEN